jgi:hypothetical protein
VLRFQSCYAVSALQLVAHRATFVATWAISIVLAASVADAAQLTLSWVDQSNGAAAFRIERKVGTSGVYGEIAQQQAGQVSYVDTTVAAGTTYCYRVRAFDAGGTSGYSNEACGSVTAALTLSVTASGSGTVTSSPSGIDCGAACSAIYPAGTVVTLTATPASGWTFTGWTSGCTGTAPCVLAANGSVAVNANFAAVPTPAPTPGTEPAPTLYRLSVNTRGPGSVSSNPNGIQCGQDCSQRYPKGTVVTLTAQPETGASFRGWSSGPCRGTATSTCTVRLDERVSVSASFK